MNIRSMHIIGSRLSGGAERFYSRMVRSLQDFGHPVLAVNRPGSMVAEDLGGEVAQIHVAMRNNLDLLSAWKISGAIKRCKPDIVLTYMSRATALTHVPRGSDTRHIARFGGYYKLKYFRHAHAWIGNTKGLCDYLVEEGLPADKVYYIPNFVDSQPACTSGELKALRESLRMPEDALVITGLGRFIEKKGFDVLIDAFSLLPGEIGGRPLWLVLVGDGPLRNALYAQARTLGLLDRMAWGGWQSNPDPFYDLADVVAFPSRFEPLGNITKEAWAHGKPIVSTSTQGSVELMDNGRTGMLVPVDEPSEMARVLELVLRDEGLRESLSKSGHEELLRFYAKDSVVNQYLELFRTLISH